MKQPLLLATLCVGAVSALAGITYVLPAENGKVTKSDSFTNVDPALHSMVSRPDYSGAENFDLGSATEYIPGGHVNFYAFQFDASGMQYYRAFLSGNTTYAAYPTVLKEYEYGDQNERILMSGTLVGDEYWGYVTESAYGSAMQKPRGIYKINLENGEIADIVIDEWKKAGGINNHLSQMSYDPLTGYIYAIRNVPLKDTLETGVVGEYEDFLCLYTSGHDDLVRIDPETKEMVVIGSIDANPGKQVRAMAASNGIIYMIRISTDNKPSLYTVDSRLYTATHQIEEGDVVNKGLINRGVDPVANCIQSMTFNHTNHELWWAKVNSSGNISMVKVNTNNMTTYTMSSINQKRMWLGLAIPYQTAELDAPAALADFEYTVGKDGAEEITFSWTNPTTDYGQNPIEELGGVKVYRDGEFIHRVAAPTPGEKYEWTDNTLKSGFHTYKLVPVNSKNGEGIAVEMEAFIGRDLPSAVYDIQGTVSGNKLTLTWADPWSGINNGWYDKSTLVYKVVRVQDGKVVAENLKGNSVVDEATDFKGYSYTITPSTADGVGREATSKTYAFGDAPGIPYYNSLNTPEEAATIQIVDGNMDGETWGHYASLYDHSNGVFRYQANENSPEEYLFLPEFKFEEGHIYEVRFFALVSGMYWFNSDPGGTFEVVQGKEKNPKSMNTILSRNEFTQIDGADHRTYEVNTYITDPSLGSYVAIRLVDELVHFVEVDDIYVVEHFPYDLAVKDVVYNDQGNYNVSSWAKVTVRNYGQNVVENTKVQIIADDDTVLGESVLDKIAKGEEKEVAVEWTPNKMGTMGIRARVIVDNDGNQDDNISNTYLVEISDTEAVRWAYLGKPENRSYQILYTTAGNCASQTIYPAEQLFADDLDIYDIEFYYDNDDANFPEIIVQLSAGETRVEYSAEGYDENWYSKCNVLDLGHNTMQTFRPEVGKNHPLSFKFDEPLRISKGKNLAIRLDYFGLATENPLSWVVFPTYRYDDDVNKEGKKRSIFKAYKDFNGCDSSPYIRFSYKSMNGVGTMDLVPGANFKVINGVICSDVAGDFQVYDLNGRQVANLKNVNTVDGLASGIYVVTATINGKTATCKVMIK